MHLEQKNISTTGNFIKALSIFITDNVGVDVKKK